MTDKDAVKEIVRTRAKSILSTKIRDETGLGNHPLLVKSWVAIGKTMAEDGAPGPAGTPPANGEAEQMKRMFPSMYNEDGTPKR